MKKFYIILSFFIFTIQICFSEYKGLVGYFDKSEEMQEFILDEEGNITFGTNYDISHEPHNISVSPDSHLILVTSGPWGDGRLDLFSIGSNLNLTYKCIALNNVAYYSPVTISPNSKYVIIIYYRTDIEDWTISLFRIEGDSLIDLNSYISITENNLLSLNRLTMSKFGGTFCGVSSQDDIDNIYEMCVFKFDEETEKISFPGQRILLSPLQGTRDTEISPNGRFCAHLGANSCVILTINPDGTVNEDLHFIERPDINQEICVFSPNSQYLYIMFVNGTIASYKVNWDGSTELIQTDNQYWLAQAFDITPDGKYGVVSHHYHINGTQIVSVIQFNSNGTFQKLDKDFTMLGHFSDLKFIPPYVTSTDDEIWEMYE